MSVISLALWSRPILAKQLDNWQVTPRPEHFTQLYFVDYRKQPAQLRAGTAQTVGFIVHNSEHRTTTYRYEIVAKAANSRTEELLGDGIVVLDYGDTRTVHHSFHAPMRATRTAVIIKLSYMGQTFGKSEPSLQTQSIHYWVTVASPISGGNHAAH